MPDDPPTSPDDPDWVNQIVARALQRAQEPTSAGGAAAPAAPSPAAPPLATAAPSPSAGAPSSNAGISGAGGEISNPAEPRSARPAQEAPARPDRSSERPVRSERRDDASTDRGGARPTSVWAEDLASEPQREPQLRREPSGDPARPRRAHPDPDQQRLRRGEPGPDAPPQRRARTEAPDSAPLDRADRRPVDHPGSENGHFGPRHGADVIDETLWHELDDDADDDPRGLLEPPEGQRLRSVLEWGAVILGALVVALLIKTFLLQAYYIPSESMVPTLNIKDRVLVNKLSYDLHDVNRGDLVVFSRPEGEPGDIEDLIKRVIGLPGETINMVDGHVYIGGQLLVEPYLPEGLETGPLVDTSKCVNDSGVEGCTIPEGYVFVMGDNRGDSRDSRFFGPIEESTIVGRAFLKVWPLSDIGFL
ncbi:MAG: signal peptidase I [Acidimicrobiales bacterium]|nr:signal peptidase I [Acidimicrobiales bacterium]